jgi:hypothetical protein
MRETTSLLEPFYDTFMRGQGGRGAFVSQALFAMSELVVFASSNEYDIFHFDRHSRPAVPPVVDDDSSGDDDGEDVDIVSREMLYHVSIQMLDIVKVRSAAEPRRTCVICKHSNFNLKV